MTDAPPPPPRAPDVAEFPDGVAVVFGGSGGVGAAVCERLAAHGADVALTYRGNAQAAEQAAARVRGHGRRASVHRIWLDDAAAVTALLGELDAAHGRVHTIACAAGSNIRQPYVSEVTPEEWRRVVDADVHGFFHVVHAALPLLRKGGGGSLVYVSSAGLARHPPGDVLSVAPKGAVEALVRAVAREEGRHGIRANVVALGVVDAGMFPRLVAQGELDEAWLAAAKRNIALRRFGTAEEVGEAVAFLASSRASYVTGQRLMLDGGYTL